MKILPKGLTNGILPSSANWRTRLGCICRCTATFLTGQNSRSRSCGASRQKRLMRSSTVLLRLLEENIEGSPAKTPTYGGSPQAKDNYLYFAIFCLILNLSVFCSLLKF